MKKTRKAAAAHSQQITPYLLSKDVGKALNWLTKAFGFIDPPQRSFGSPTGRV